MVNNDISPSLMVLLALRREHCSKGVVMCSEIVYKAPRLTVSEELFGFAVSICKYCDGNAVYEKNPF